jgi:hypothetical protein
MKLPVFSVFRLFRGMQIVPKLQWHFLALLGKQISLRLAGGSNS